MKTLLCAALCLALATAVAAQNEKEKEKKKPTLRERLNQLKPRGGEANADTSDNGPQGGGIMGNLLGGEAPSVQADYQFTTSYRAEQYSDSKPDEKATLRYYFGNQCFASEMEAQPNQKEEGQMLMVFDVKNMSTLTIFTGKEAKKGEKPMAMAAKMPQIDPDKANEGKGVSDFKITETNETKTILGYRCRKYIGENDEYRTESWITEDIPQINQRLTMALVAKSSRYAQNTAAYYPENAFVLESTMFNKKKKETYHMKVIEVKPNESRALHTSDYQVTDMMGREVKKN